MSQRTAIVTGGIGGLGTEFCRHLAQQGATVVAADIAAQMEAVKGLSASQR